MNIKRTTSFLSLLLGLILCSACTSELTVDNSVSGELDLEKYLGTWYEVARFDHSFERGMSFCKAEYILRDDGKVDVLNTGMKDGKPKEAKGKAKLTDNPRILRVSFFGPFYGDYRIMFLDDDYQWVLVGGSSDDYLWILSRTPKLEDVVREAILAEAVRRGYDVSKLIWVEQ
ncbi:MAG: lipocalin family protein [Bacteroidaceae bacterium]|nr:lipocalin family protein [Bacteroidaceae bacterium]